MSEVPVKAKWWHPETKTMSEPLSFLVFDAEKIPCVFTGLVAQDGNEIYDEDIVAAKDIPAESMTVPPEPGVIVDRVHWENGAWRLGSYEGCLADFELVAVQGNTFEKPWPAPQ